jgi:hypothetical protein
MTADRLVTRHRDTWRAIGAAVVPELIGADEPAWREIEGTIAHALATRPARLRRQLALLLGLIAVAARLRFGRSLRALDRVQRERFLLALPRAPVALLRRGLWGIRTLVLMGHYTRPEAARALGYRADPHGWSAARTEPVIEAE